MRVTHDGCILDFSVFAKDFSQVFLFDLLSEPSDEKIGALVVLLATGIGLSVAEEVLACSPGNTCLKARTDNHHHEGGHPVKRCGCEPRWCHGRGEVNETAHAAHIRGYLRLEEGDVSCWY